MTRIRRALGLLAIAAAIRWAIASRRPPAIARYPNEWGVRTTPLTPAELGLALEEEARIARRLDDEREAAIPSATPAAAVVPNHGGPPARSLFGGPMDHTGSGQTPPQGVVRAPVEHPTRPDITAAAAVENGVDGSIPDQSGVLTTSARLTLSEVVTGDDAADVLESLDRIAQELRRLSDEAWDSSRDLDNDPDLRDAALKLGLAVREVIRIRRGLSIALTGHAEAVAR